MVLGLVINWFGFIFVLFGCFGLSVWLGSGLEHWVGSGMGLGLVLATGLVLRLGLGLIFSRGSLILGTIVGSGWWWLGTMGGLAGLGGWFGSISGPPLDFPSMVFIKGWFLSTGLSSTGLGFCFL